MSKFGSFERTIARQLDNFPALRGFAKKAYQYLNYLSRREKGFVFHIEDGWEITTPAALAGCLGPATGSDEFVGYFNLSPWSPSGRHFVVHRRALGQTNLEVGFYDFEAQRYSAVEETPVWTKQQAALSQWIKGGDMDGHLAFNTMSGNEIGCRIVDSDGKQVVWLPRTIQHTHGASNMACGVNPLRLHAVGSDYGINLTTSNLVVETDMNNDGLWLIPLSKDKPSLAVSLAQVIASAPVEEMKDATRQELNHAWFSPSGSHIVFMHRWYNHAGRRSALLTYDIASGAIVRILETGMVSHYSFYTNKDLIIWCKGTEGVDAYFSLDIITGHLTPSAASGVGDFGDGHPVGSVKQDYFISDCYPNRARQQALFSFSQHHNEPIELIGRFFAPMRFSGPDRVDLHPRRHPTEMQISIDSCHTGVRRTYIVHKL